MPIQPDFLELFTDTIVIEPHVGYDEYGQPTYGPPVTYPCQSQSIFFRGVEKDMVQEVPWGQIFIPGDAPMSLTSRITLSDGSQPPLSGIMPAYDDHGLHHWEVYTVVRPLREEST